jgi:hypothetical protein
MDKAISDGVVIDYRGKDPASVLTQASGSDVQTALDRLLDSQAENYNGFSSFMA